MGTEASQDWIAEAQKLLELTKEAQEFADRASSHFPAASPSHAVAIAHLWMEAERLDPQMYGLLDEANERLLAGSGELDMTRGASMRSIVVGQELLLYDCVWSLDWWENRGISIRLSVEPEVESYHVRVEGSLSGRTKDIRHPVREDQLKEALTKTYVAEMTA